MCVDILCLMGLFPKEFEDEIITNSIRGIQNAANNLQWAIVDGLTQQEAVDLHIVNSLYVGSYPKKYKKVRIPSFPFAVNGKACGYNAGFFNLPLVKIVNRYLSAKKKIDEWAKTPSNEPKVVIAYAMTTPMVELLQHIKSRYPAIRCLLFVPDLPEYMNMANESSLYSLAKDVHIKHLKKALRAVDGYIFLTEYMQDWFDVPVEYTVIEGIYKGDTAKKEPVTKKDKTILYSGGIYEEYGVLDLVQAFRRIDADDWTLELIGDGNLVPMLKEIAKEDNRIVLRGLMPNAQVVARQREVSILVNPRGGKQSFTKYSFPSKTIEYMASGTPMAGYRLAGIPDEYYNYIYEISEEENGLCDSLKALMQMTAQEREDRGAKAQQFIFEKKNAAMQCRKICELIDRIL